jgi:very-short-patch-repair endonuclease
MSVLSEAEEAFNTAWAKIAPNGSDLVRELEFHPERQWRFDFAFPSQKIAVEIDGRGRHQNVVGVRNDCDKNNEALRLGWRIVRFPATDKRFADDWARTVLLIILAGAEQNVSRSQNNGSTRTTRKAA